MPHYKAYVSFNAAQSGAQDTITITLEANNAIEAKALLQDRYGDKAVQSIKRQDRAHRKTAQGSSSTHAAAMTQGTTSTERDNQIKARA